MFFFLLFSGEKREMTKKSLLKKTLMSQLEASGELVKSLHLGKPPLQREVPYFHR